MNSGFSGAFHTTAIISSKKQQLCKAHYVANACKRAPYAFYCSEQLQHILKRITNLQMPVSSALYCTY